MEEKIEELTKKMDEIENALSVNDSIEACVVPPNLEEIPGMAIISEKMSAISEEKSLPTSPDALQIKEKFIRPSCKVTDTAL